MPLLPFHYPFHLFMFLQLFLLPLKLSISRSIHLHSPHMCSAFVCVVTAVQQMQVNESSPDVFQHMHKDLSIAFCFNEVHKLHKKECR